MMTIVRRANSCQVRILLALKLLMTDLRVERGTLFASRSDVVASHWVMWALANLALFLLPFSTGIWVIFLLRYLGAIPSTSASISPAPSSTSASLWHAILSSMVGI
jgi:hypothetical protein